MTVTFISNFLNHHQVPICEELYLRLGTNFNFVSTEPTPEIFLNSGYPNCEAYPYNVLVYKSEREKDIGLHLLLKSDIVIIGAYNKIIVDYTNARLKTGKPLLKYTERWHKEWKSYLYLPYHVLNGTIWRNHLSLKNKQVYLLCAGGYVTNDADLIGAYSNKRFKWGYFTAVDRLEIEDVLNDKKNRKVRLLWVGRFIKWKHPELPVKLAYRLKRKGFDFCIDMIGTGFLVEEIQRLIDRLDVSDIVRIVGSMPNSEVVDAMRQSHIFLFTSNRQEGWGAVLNEAMSNGCAVVASDKIGAVPYLLGEPNTGMIFKSGSVCSLQNSVEVLLRRPDLRDEMAINAYNVMCDIWSPKNAVDNLLKLCHAIQEDNLDGLEIELGPCSKA